MKTDTDEVVEKSGLGSLLEDKLPELEHAAGRLADHVRAHPLPYTLVGAGLALVAIRALTHRDTPAEAAIHAVEKAGSRARETIDHLAERAGEVKDKAVGAAQRANRSVTTFAEKNPLVIGAGIVVARFLAELVLKRKTPRQAVRSMEGSRDLRKNLREFLRSVLDDAA